MDFLSFIRELFWIQNLEILCEINLLLLLQRRREEKKFSWKQHRTRTLISRNFCERVNFCTFFTVLCDMKFFSSSHSNYWSSLIRTRLKSQNCHFTDISSWHPTDCFGGLLPGDATPPFFWRHFWNPKWSFLAPPFKHEVSSVQSFTATAAAGTLVPNLPKFEYRPGQDTL